MELTNTIGELAIAMPNAIPVLERLRIDYCCHGKQSVQQACSNAGVSTEELLQLIRNTPATADERAWDGVSMTDITKFIVDTHHAYTRQALMTLQFLSQKVAAAHGERHPELIALQKFVGQLVGDLLPHMLKEEQVLFPYIFSLDEAIAGDAEVPIPFFGTVKNPVRMMMLEHETAGEVLAEIRQLTNGFAVPDDGCTSYRAYYKALADLEQDLHRHIHLENNVLFPKAIEAEDGAAVNEMAGVVGDHHRCG